ncbi:MAG: magnesium transporter [Arachnia sp.]
MTLRPSFTPEQIRDFLYENDLPRLSELLHAATPGEIVEELRRLRGEDRAIVFRLLPKDSALEVFERLDHSTQGDLVELLQAHETAAVFDALDPDDRVSLLDELPAGIAAKLMTGLAPEERDLTAVVLGYAVGSIGRRMSPEVATIPLDTTVGEALSKAKSRALEAETVYTLSVVDDSRRLMGVVGLRDLLAAEETSPVASLVVQADTALATEPAEDAARRCSDLGHLALPVVDHEDRLVGILTVDDALAILKRAESEDQARMSGTEPIRGHYLATSVGALVRSRVVWLLVLAVGASLTVQVLEIFEATLSQMIVLSVFVPLLIGTGGNTGNQAATTVTRALALGEVRGRDWFRVIRRESAVGVLLGVTLGSLGFVITGLVYGLGIGSVIGLTLLTVCTLAATVGGTMPLIAKAVRADPAVFSNPFISTFIDATGLFVYFGIAKLILGI